MTATERRQEIEHIMICEREITVSVLAARLGVSERTIRRDVVHLMCSIPLETVQGNGGGIRLMPGYSPYRMTLSKGETDALIDIMDRLNEVDRETVRGILKVHSGYFPKD